MCAVFNPEVKPTNSPSYGSESRAIDIPNSIPVQGVETNRIMPKGQEIGDRSAEFLGQASAARMQGEAAANKGFSDLFAGLVGTGDFLAKAGVQVVKKDIEKQVYEIANQERETYTAELEKIKAAGTNNILDANASMDEPAPSEIEDLPNELETLRSARDSGKITKTDYAGRLLNRAKILRQQHPNFKKEIDAEFAAVTGMNPANARINSLITEINKDASAKASAQNKTLSFIKSNADVPRADEMYVGFLNGSKTEAEVFSHISQYRQAKERMSLRASQAADTNLSREERSLRATKDSEYALGVTVAGVADGLMGKLGIDTAAKVDELQTLQNNGGIPQKKWEALNATVANEMTSLRVKMLAQLDKQGLTRNFKGGKEDAIKVVDRALEPLKTIQQRIISKDFGGMHEAARETKLILDDAKHSLLTDSKAGPMWQSINAAKELGGEQYMQDLAMRDAFKRGGVADSYADWAKRWSGAIATQRKKTLGGETVTYMDLVEEMKTKGIAANDPKQQQAILGTLVEKVGDIGKAKVPDAIKINIAEAAFDPKNREFLSQLNMDGYDRNNKQVKGMNAVFQKWTSEDVTKEIKRLNKTSPGLWNKYQDWVTHTFANTLVRKEIKELAALNNQDIKVGWDTDNKRFKVESMDLPVTVVGGGQGFNNPDRTGREMEVLKVERFVNRINSNIYNLKSVAENSGQNVDAFVMKSIADADPAALRNVHGLPYQIIRNMAIGSLKKK